MFQTESKYFAKRHTKYEMCIRDRGKGLKKKEFGCEGCAMAAMCGGARKEKNGCVEKGAEEAC